VSTRVTFARMWSGPESDGAVCFVRPKDLAGSAAGLAAAVLAAAAGGAAVAAPVLVAGAPDAAAAWALALPLVDAELAAAAGLDFGRARES
jgi:hypothetical protein